MFLRAVSHHRPPPLRSSLVLSLSIASSLLFGAACQKSSSDSSPPPPAPPTEEGQVTPIVDASPTGTPLAPAEEGTPAPAPLSPSPTGGEEPSVTPPTEGGANPVVAPGTDPAPQPAPNPEPAPAPADPGPVTPPPSGEPPLPTPTPTELRIKETQFWVFERKDKALSFNTPWDETEGDAISRDESAAPLYAQKCLNEAKDLYQNLAMSKDFKNRMGELFELSVTPELIFLVNVTDADNDRNALRQMDRDAYFWHWTDPAKKPVISLSSYAKGVWVWEVIAGPKTCIQPSMKEIGRYLAWTKKRLLEKGANP